MRVRIAHPHDAPTLHWLACETYAGHFASLWSAEGLKAFLQREFGLPGLAIALASADQAWFLASDGDRPVGYAKINWQRTEPHSGITGAELQKIYFLGDAVGRGLGAQLLAHVTYAARAHGESYLWLNVLGSNTSAMRFYERHGFDHLGASVFQSDIGPMQMLTMGRALG